MWVQPDTRDDVIDFVRVLSDKTNIFQRILIRWLGISRSKFYDWQKRYGKVNEHNGFVPRDFWLEEWEKDAIISYFIENPTEGYRRLTYMMMDDEVVAASCSSVYRVLSAAGLIGRRTLKRSTKGQGFQQPLKPHEHWHIDITHINIGGIMVEENQTEK